MERKKYVVIMAAGSGTRMGGDLPKQFMEIGGKAILRRTIEAFVQACPGITVVTVLPEVHVGYWRDYCIKSNFICPQIIVKGGITRFHSVRNALSKVPDGALVAVHDGVRPFVTPELIRKMYDRAAQVPALIPVLPCVDTMKMLKKKKDAEGNPFLDEIPGAHVDRELLYGAQTPQIFHSEILGEAYSQAYDTAFTDDASVVSAHGKKLSFMIGERLNIKITTQEDLVLAKAILEVIGKN